MQIDIKNIKGETVGMHDMPEQVFGVVVSPVLVHQVVIAQKANAREVIAHTKDRGEVRGGGKKPWKQKGTGRARHGSIRSPLWIGGGVTFGPRNDRNFSQQINKKMKKKALCMVLSDKFRNASLILLDSLNMKKPNTKEFKTILEVLAPVRKVLVVIDVQNENIWKSALNLSNVRVSLASSLNVVDTLNADIVLMTQGSVSIIESMYGNYNAVNKEAVSQ